MDPLFRKGAHSFFFELPPEPDRYEARDAFLFFSQRFLDTDVFVDTFPHEPSILRVGVLSTTPDKHIEQFRLLLSKYDIALDMDTSERLRHRAEKFARAQHIAGRLQDAIMKDIIRETDALEWLGRYI